MIGLTKQTSLKTALPLAGDAAREIKEVGRLGWAGRKVQATGRRKCTRSATAREQMLTKMPGGVKFGPYAIIVAALPGDVARRGCAKWRNGPHHILWSKPCPRHLSATMP